MITGCQSPGSKEVPRRRALLRGPTPPAASGTVTPQQGGCRTTPSLPQHVRGGGNRRQNGGRFTHSFQENAFQHFANYCPAG